MAEPFRAQGTSTALDISAAPVNHLPIVAHFARRLGLVDIFNRLVPTQMEVEPGVIALGLVLDTLSGRSPLYHLETAFEECDRTLLFGQDLPAPSFNDDTLGRMLDCFYAVGTQRLFSALSVAALERFPVSTQHAHFDTTSMTLYGDYPTAQGEEAPFQITHGYSKDKRPDLKQLVLAMLCVDANVPILGRLEDGNASDKAINHRLLSEISGHMHQYGIEPDAFVYIADSALVTAANRERLGEETRFITRLPATYNEHDRVILSAIEADAWSALGTIGQTPPTKNRPGASYRVHEGSVELYGRAYRAVVVHSSAHDQRRLKRLERELKASRRDTEQVAKAAAKKTFFCRADAAAAAAAVRAYPSAFHQLSVRIEERPRYGRGRPKKNAAKTPVAIDLCSISRSSSSTRRSPGAAKWPAASSC
jgi:transposase